MPSYIFQVTRIGSSSNYSPGGYAPGGTIFSAVVTTSGTDTVTNIDMYDIDNSLITNNPDGYTMVSGPYVMQPVSGNTWNSSGPAGPVALPIPQIMIDGYDPSFLGNQYMTVDFYDGTTLYFRLYKYDYGAEVFNLAETFYSMAGDYSISEPSCLIDQTVIDTVIGPQVVSQLQPGEMVYDIDKNVVPIIKIWKSIHSLDETIILVNHSKVYCTMSHSIYIPSYKKWMFGWELVSNNLARIVSSTPGYLYQIEHASYGVWSGNIALSTWTPEYLSCHDHNGFA